MEQNDLPLSNLTDRQAVASGGIKATTATPAISGNANLYRTYQGFGNILQAQNSTNTNYHSLQTALRMQNKHGLSLQAAYTWSHEIDLQSSDLATASNPYNLAYDRGSGTLDRRNIFNINYVYDLPFYLHSGSFAERMFLGGWQISGVTVAEAGAPLGVTYNGPDTLGLGGNTTNRPNLVSGVGYPKRQKEWFSTAAFAAPAAPWTAAGTGYYRVWRRQQGRSRRPRAVLWNLSLYKNIPIHEDIHMQFRAEYYNIWNHTEFNAVDTGSNDGNFGPSHQHLRSPNAATRSWFLF